MGRKKKTEEIEPLSEFQDTALTGRTEIPVISIDASDLDDLAERAKRKTINIRSAELVDQMFCNYKYKHNVGPNTTNTVSTKSEVPVHPDMVMGFRKLDAHLALICEEVDASLIGDINDIDHQPTSDKISKFTVTKFSLDGGDAALSVVLSGTKELSTGEAIKLETPKIFIDDSYPFATELGGTIQDCVAEVEEYMKGKQADDPQQELPFGEVDKLVEEGV
jgi:hypothetical protein